MRTLLRPRATATSPSSGAGAKPETDESTRTTGASVGGTAASGRAASAPSLGEVLHAAISRATKETRMVSIPLETHGLPQLAHALSRLDVELSQPAAFARLFWA